jgi:hypothetical protein
MNCKSMIFTLLFVFTSSPSVFSQGQPAGPHIRFCYDETGNRTCRVVEDPNKSQQLPDSDQFEPQDTLLVVEEEPSPPDITTGSEFDQNIGLNEEEQISVYPNPTDKWLTVQIHNYQSGTIVEISIFDFQGRCLLNENWPVISKYDQILVLQRSAQ